MEGFAYKNYDGLGLAELIKNKELQLREVLAAAIKTIEEHNPRLNAVINKFYEKSEREAETVNLNGTVRDRAAMLDEISVYEKYAAFHTLPFQGSYLQQLQTATDHKYTIAFSVQSPLGTEAHQDCKDAVIKTGKLLESWGH